MTSAADVGALQHAGMRCTEKVSCLRSSLRCGSFLAQSSDSGEACDASSGVMTLKKVETMSNSAPETSFD